MTNPDEGSEDWPDCHTITSSGLIMTSCGPLVPRKVSEFVVSPSALAPIPFKSMRM